MAHDLVRMFLKPLPRPDPAQHGRLVEIRDNLVNGIAEAEREGWLGEIEGLRVSLAGAQSKISQIDTAAGSGRCSACQNGGNVGPPA